MTIIVLWLFPTVTWIGLQRVIVIFSDHTHLLTFLFIFIFFISCDIPIFIVGLAFALEMLQDLAVIKTKHWLRLEL